MGDDHKTPMIGHPVQTEKQRSKERRILDEDGSDPVYN